jgi:hypothetical protein
VVKFFFVVNVKLLPGVIGVRNASKQNLAEMMDASKLKT